jgi:hypothetical protein
MTGDPEYNERVRPTRDPHSDTERLMVKRSRLVQADYY